ncbi:MAG: hypothetical protein V1649_00265 [Patescibacteria group bacterium]
MTRELNKNIFEDTERERERERESKEREITLENLTNEDILKAIIIWYEKGNQMLNLAKRWGEKIWEIYQTEPERFFKQGHDDCLNAGRVENDLLDFGISEARFGFKIGGMGYYENPDAKLKIIFDKKDDKEENNKKGKIQFKVDTNDRGNKKEYRQANYLLAKNIIEEWKKIGLPVDERFGNLEKEEIKEILEITKDEKKLKKFWESLSI